MLVINVRAFIYSVSFLLIVPRPNGWWGSRYSIWHMDLPMYWWFIHCPCYSNRMHISMVDTFGTIVHGSCSCHQLLCRKTCGLVYIVDALHFAMCFVWVPFILELSNWIWYWLFHCLIGIHPVFINNFKMVLDCFPLHWWFIIQWKFGLPSRYMGHSSCYRSFSFQHHVFTTKWTLQIWMSRSS